MKRFRSPNGKDIRVESLSGHIAIISSEFRELPEFLWSDAYAKGAVSEDMKTQSIDDYVEQKKLEQIEKEKVERDELKSILKNLFDNPKDVLDSKGNIVHRKVIQFVGKPVKKDIIDSIWSEIVTENIEE